jgi:hypothetical protein
VLVHCYYGQSRSATVVLAYLLEYYSPKLSLGDAFDLLKGVKPDICINPGFLSQLHLFFHRLKYPAEYDLLHNTYFKSHGCSDFLGKKRRTNPKISTGKTIMRCEKCKFEVFDDFDAVVCKWSVYISITN